MSLPLITTWHVWLRLSSDFSFSCAYITACVWCRHCVSVFSVMIQHQYQLGCVWSRPSALTVNSLIASVRVICIVQYSLVMMVLTAHEGLYYCLQRADRQLALPLPVTSTCSGKKLGSQTANHRKLKSFCTLLSVSCCDKTDPHGLLRLVQGEKCAVQQGRRNRV